MPSETRQQKPSVMAAALRQVPTWFFGPPINRRARMADPEFRDAYLANELEVRVRTGKLACWLVIILMPVGGLLDQVVYPQLASTFLFLRLLCSFLVTGVLALHFVPLRLRTLRTLQMLIVWLPAICLDVIIVQAAPKDLMHSSPYYAALNLILLAISAVGHWAFWDTLLSASGVLFMYILIEELQSPTQHPYDWSNLYFLVLTGIIVVGGNLLFNRLAFQEFESRFELAKNRRTLEAANRQLEETNRQLKELDQVKSRFFANISHELRTPLTLLLAPLEVLLNEHKSAFNEAERESLGIMQENGLRLLRLINQLLDLVRLESGRMEVHREPVAIRELLDGLASAVRKVVEDKGLKLSVVVADEVGTVLADRDKLEKILLNLIFNAIKFTPADGQIRVECLREDNQLWFCVRDTGMGIAPEQMPFLFKPFWQADTSTRRRHGGSGLGLALVKELTEIQGGSVAVESEAGQGTVFKVSLPHQSAAAVPPGAVTGKPKRETDTELTRKLPDEWVLKLNEKAKITLPISSPKDSLRPGEVMLPAGAPCVLIADDEPDMLRFLKLKIGGDYQVIEATDGHQALDKAAQFLPDVIVCDMMMPGKDGLQVCREIRGRVSTRSIPFVLVTASAEENVKRAALEAGVNDFLQKPFDLLELRLRIRNLIENYQLQKKIKNQNQILESRNEQIQEAQQELEHKHAELEKAHAQRKRDEALIIEQAKMALLGTLSAGLFHEINNPLNFINTEMHLLRSFSGALPESQRPFYAELTTDLEDGLRRIQEIASAFRVYSHPDRAKLDYVALDKVADTALKLFKHELKDGIRLEQNLAEGHTLWGNEGKLVQVLMNLVKNAIHAVKKKHYDGGTPTIWLESRIEGDQNLIIVRDNGIGIRPEDQAKIFEPFFTTKDVGEGSGLGLFNCYGYIKEHGGRIRMRSEPGEFCEFAIEIPRLADIHPPATHSNQPTEELTYGNHV